MGDALGKGLLAAFLVFGFMALTGGIVFISGIVTLIAAAVAKSTLALKVALVAGEWVSSSYDTEAI